MPWSTLNTALYFAYNTNHLMYNNKWTKAGGQTPREHSYMICRMCTEIASRMEMRRFYRLHLTLEKPKGWFQSFPMTYHIICIFFACPNNAGVSCKTKEEQLVQPHVFESVNNISPPTRDSEATSKISQHRRYYRPRISVSDGINRWVVLLEYSIYCSDLGLLRIL